MITLPSLPTATTYLVQPMAMGKLHTAMCHFLLMATGHQLVCTAMGQLRSTAMGNLRRTATRHLSCTVTAAQCATTFARQLMATVMWAGDAGRPPLLADWKEFLGATDFMHDCEGCAAIWQDARTSF